MHDPASYNPEHVECEFRTEVFWPTMSKSLPPVLYHYTNADGLCGILKSRSFRLGHFSYLNDARELTYGLNLGVERLRHHRSTAVDKTRDLLDRAISAFDGDYFKNWMQSMSPFVTCFCENGDLLSQWRAYGGDGAGYAIGFDTSKFKTLTGQFPATGPTDLFAIKVEYDTSVQSDLIDRSIQIALKEFDRVQTEPDWDADGSIGLAVAVLSVCFYEVSLCFKHPGFSEENEWRLIELVRDAARVNTRVANGVLKPYVEVPIPGDSAAVKRIVVGPRQQQSGMPVNYPIAALLRTNGYKPEKVTISPSKTPYR